MQDMELSRILYISEIAQPMSAAQLDELISHSSHRNEMRGLSGLLLYSGANFLQVLEGEPLRLTSLFKAISADPRHKNVRLLLNKPATSRLFPDWGMNMVDVGRAAKIDRSRIDKVLLQLRLEREDANGLDALTLMQEVRDQMSGQAA